MATSKSAFYIKDVQLSPLGFQQITSLSSSTALTVPERARYALIHVETQNVRFRDDGTAPTASVGIQIQAGEKFFYNGNLSAVRFIQEAASATMNVSYYA